MLRADDLVPQSGAHPFSYALTDKQDKRAFAHLAAAHRYLIKRLLENQPLDVSRYFVPPWYNSFFVRNAPQLARQYFNQLTLNFPSNIGLFWTGPTVRSLSIDAHELKVFKRLISDHPLSPWDNTIYARRHKDFWLSNDSRTELLSFFEPFSVSLPKGYLSQNQEGEDLLLINGQLSNFN